MGRIGYALVGLLLLGNGGCLWVAVGGAAAGGAAAGIAYLRGRLYHEYHADLPHAQAGVLAALQELQLQVLRQDPADGKVTLETRATDGTTIRIYLKTTATSPIPSDGALTRVSVRVGTFGDEDVSARILHQVDLHLLPPDQLPPTPPPPLIGPIQQTGATGPPPPASDRLVPVPQPTGR